MRINMFSALSQKSVSVPAVQPAQKRAKDAWRNDPITVPGSGQRSKQFVTLTRLLRSKDLLQISDPAIRTMVANVAVFDDETGHWTELPKLTKGQASDLIDALMALPNVGFSPVVSEQAEPVADQPVTVPASKPKKQTKSAEVKSAAIGIHETEDGLRFEVYRDGRGALRTRMV